MTPAGSGANGERADGQLCPARHSYPVGVIDLFVRMVLSAATSIRSAAAVLELLAGQLPFPARAPCPNSGRSWLLRIGLFQLTCDKEQADDWVWMMDHTLQLGPYKCLIILGIRLSAWDSERPLRHEDMTLLNLKSKARYMNLDTLVRWATRTLAYLDASDEAPDPSVDRRKLREKLAWLRSYRPALKRWGELLAVARTAEKMVHGGIHASICDELRAELEPLVTTPAARRMRRRVLAFLADQSAGLSTGERLIGSTEVLESVIGKYKRVQSCHSKGGMTAMLLSIGAMLGRQTTSGIKQALEVVRSADVDTWCKNHLGITLQSQRRRALGATKTG